MFGLFGFDGGVQVEFAQDARLLLGGDVHLDPAQQPPVLAE